jgi:hypothetical protein
MQHSTDQVCPDWKKGKRKLLLIMLGQRQRKMEKVGPDFKEAMLSFSHLL